MIIRPANHSDIEHIIDIWNPFMMDLGKTNNDYYKKVDSQSFSNHLIDVIPSQKGILLISESKGEITGFILGYVEALPEWFGSKQIGLIRYLAIKEAHHNLGTGKSLLEEAVKWYKNKNIHRIELYVLNGLKADGFWRKMGFKPLMERRFIEI